MRQFRAEGRIQFRRWKLELLVYSLFYISKPAGKMCSQSGSTWLAAATYSILFDLELDRFLLLKNISGVR